MQQLNEDIKNGQFKQVYLLYGEEAYLRKQYRDKLKSAMVAEDDTMNSHYYEGKDINAAEIVDLAETMPFFADRRVIVLENTGWFKSGGDRMADYLEEPAESVCFIFVESEVDKRNRVFKAVQKQGRAVCFEAQDERTLLRWLAGILKQDGKQISENTAQFFLDRVGTDMSNIRTELEKLSCYCMDKDVIERQDVEAVCTVSITNRIFDMVAAISEKRTEAALTMYYDLVALKEPPLRILFLISRQCNMLLQAKQLKSKGYDNKGIAEKMGVAPFVAGKYLTQASRFKEKELRAALARCVEAEESVKTGKMNEAVAVEMLIISVF